MSIENREIYLPTTGGWLAQMSEIDLHISVPQGFDTEPREVVIPPLPVN